MFSLLHFPIAKRWTKYSRDFYHDIFTRWRSCKNVFSKFCCFWTWHIVDPINTNYSPILHIQISYSFGVRRMNTPMIRTNDVKLCMCGRSRTTCSANSEEESSPVWRFWAYKTLLRKSVYIVRSEAEGTLWSDAAWALRIRHIFPRGVWALT